MSIGTQAPLRGVTKNFLAFFSKSTVHERAQVVRSVVRSFTTVSTYCTYCKYIRNHYRELRLRRTTTCSKYVGNTETPVLDEFRGWKLIIHTRSRGSLIPVSRNRGLSALPFRLLLLPKKPRCLARDPKKKKIPEVGSPIRNKGQGKGWPCFYFLIICYPVKCHLSP